jgi:O-antigen/teichoic acid export membrane protein
LVTSSNDGTGRQVAPRGLTRRALGGFFWTFSGTGVQLTVQIIVIMALGRLITPAEFGLMGAAAVVIAFSQTVSQLGVGPALIQRRELDPTHLRVAFTLSAGLGLVLGVAVWLGAPPIAHFYRMPALEPVLRGIAWLFPIDGFNTVGKSLLMRQLRFRQLVAFDVAGYVLGYAGVGVALAWLGYGVWALVVANLAQTSIRAVTMYFVTRHPVRPSLHLQSSKDLLGYGVGHSLAQVGQVLAQQGDNIVVGRWLGPTALGIYGRAYQLMVMPAVVFQSIVNRVLFPVMAQVQDDRARLAGAYERALALVALASLPISAFLLIVAPEFIPVLLGPAWTEVIVPFQVLAFSLLFRMSSKISDSLTKAAGAVYARAVRQGLFAGMILAGALIGQRWGVVGVSVGVSVAMAIDFLSMAQLSWYVSGLSWSRFFRAHTPGLLLAALVGGPVLIVVEAARAAHLGKIPVLAVATLIAAAVIGVTLRTRWHAFLGPHGLWAFDQAGELLRQGPGRWRVASVGKANPE